MASVLSLRQLDTLLRQLDRYVDERMALLLSKRHGRRGRGHGLKLIIGSGNRLGLERLAGTIVFKRTAHATQ